MLTDILRPMLKSHEGRRLRLYHCPAGKLTIGYGRNIEDNGIYPSEAELMLDNDIKRSIDNCAKHVIGWLKLNEARQAVLANMAFNMGICGLLKFHKMLGAVAAGNFNLAADEMLDSTWALQVGARARTLAVTMQTGQLDTNNS